MEGCSFELSLSTRFRPPFQSNVIFPRLRSVCFSQVCSGVVPVSGPWELSDSYFKWKLDLSRISLEHRSYSERYSIYSIVPNTIKTTMFTQILSCKWEILYVFRIGEISLRCGGPLKPQNIGSPPNIDGAVRVSLATGRIQLFGHTEAVLPRHSVCC